MLKDNPDRQTFSKHKNKKCGVSTIITDDKKMKNYLLFIGCFCFTSISLGQTIYISNNPTFDSVIVIPTNPTNNDSTKFIIHISNEKPDRVFFKFCDSLGNCTTKTKISNDSIYIYELSGWPFSDTTETFIDTINLGKLNLGQYKILLINEEHTYIWPTNPTSYIDTAIFNLPIILSIYEDNKEIGYSKVFPNPFSSQTVLRTNNFLSNAALTVYNCFGQTVKQIKNISGQTITLHRDNLITGLYFIRLTQDNKIITTKKLVITD